MTLPEIYVITTVTTIVFVLLLYRTFFYDPWASLSNRLSKYEHPDAPKRFRRVPVRHWTELDEQRPTVPILRAFK